MKGMMTDSFDTVKEAWQKLPSTDLYLDYSVKLDFEMGWSWNPTQQLLKSYITTDISFLRKE
jgi:hypothetical protein